MPTIYMATGDALAVIRRQNGAWQAALRLSGLPTQCLAADPLRPGHIYCGTFGGGLWTSEDAGETWTAAGIFRRKHCRSLCSGSCESVWIKSPS